MYVVDLIKGREKVDVENSKRTIVEVERTGKRYATGLGLVK